ncbi:MAG: hypothetical protein ACHQQS_03045 [Thermoanaerobaculales bacterium]
MKRSAAGVPLLVVLGLLLAAFYPSLMLDDRLSPEASLKSVPPWRQQLGPYPKPSPLFLAAATRLGPRLACISRDAFSVALWDPWIGGGRQGWLAAPEEGGAPLPLIAGLIARPDWAWTALVALELGVGFLVPWWVARRLGLGPWPAAVTGLSYGLSGAVTFHWLDWQGSALVLGPLALVPVTMPQTRRWRGIASWAMVIVLLILSGAPAMPFIAAAVCLAVLSRPLLGHRQRWGGVMTAGVLALMVVLPSRWLDHAGAEPGAAAPIEQPGPPAGDLRAFVVPLEAAALGGEAPGTPAVGPGASAFLGATTLALALLGIGAAPPRLRGYWLAIGALCLATVVLPAAIVGQVAGSQRQFGLLALAVAVLAGYGAEALSRRLSPGTLAEFGGAVLCAVVALTLAPPAGRNLPFAPQDEARLPSPVPSRALALDARGAAILNALPPDVGATLGLADVRGAFFRREPRYARLLGATPSGELPISRALSTECARLGLRWLVEPLSLHVISGEIFARADQADLRVSDEQRPDGLRRFPAEAPLNACRLGLPAAYVASRVWLERPGDRRELAPDPALATESAAWQWFSMPEAWLPGPTALALQLGSAAPSRLMVAWDDSGLRLRREEHGVRLWEWDDAPPLVFLASAVQAEGGVASDDPHACTLPPERLLALQAAQVTPATGKVTVERVTPTAVEAEVTVANPALLAIEVKYRPALWRAEVNHAPARSERVNGVWTGIVVPAGRSQVMLRARVPLPIWLVSGGAALAVVALAVVRRV